MSDQRISREEMTLLGGDASSMEIPTWIKDRNSGLKEDDAMSEIAAIMPSSSLYEEKNVMRGGHRMGIKRERVESRTPLGELRRLAARGELFLWRDSNVPYDQELMRRVLSKLQLVLPGIRMMTSITELGRIFRPRIARGALDKGDCEFVIEEWRVEVVQD